MSEHKTFFKHDMVTRGAQKSREDRQFEKRREIARYEAFKHFGGCCAKCGVPLKLKVSEARHEFNIAHAHEEPPRSQGGDPLNPQFIVILCAACHDHVTRHELFIIVHDPWPGRGTFGRVSFTRDNPSRSDG